MAKRGTREGHIRKRQDGRWEGTVRLGYRDGKLVRPSVYGLTRGEVQEKLEAVRRVENGAQSGRHMEPGRAERRPARQPAAGQEGGVDGAEFSAGEEACYCREESASRFALHRGDGRRPPNRGGVRAPLVRCRPDEGKATFAEPKSAASRRTVKLPEAATAALKRHRTRQKRARLAAGDAWIDSGLVFTSTIGTVLDYANVRRDFKVLLKSAKLPVELRLHDLRHTCATLLMAQGTPAKIVMQTLGHSQVNLTLDTYSHVSAELQAQAADAMDAVLKSA
jgi:Phage integrase family